MSTENDARRSLVTALRNYLVGPHKEVEDELLQAGVTNERGRQIIRQFPHDFYHTGALSPSGTEIDEEESEQERNDGDPDSGAGDGILALANASQQSALGVTTRIHPDAASINVTLEWGKYQLVARKDDGEWNDYDAGSGIPSLELGWKRKQVSHTINLSLGDLPSDGTKIEVQNHEGIRLFARARLKPDALTLTVALVNSRQIPKSWSDDQRIYQCRIHLSSPNLGKIFLPSESPPNLDDREAWNYELLYRNACEFGVGHGCGVMWDDSGNTTTDRIWTEWVPEAEVFKASASIERLKDSKVFELKTLSNFEDREGICIQLQAIPDAYSNWIGEQREQLLERFRGDSQEQEAFRQAGLENLRICEAQVGRIESGIDALRTGDDKLWMAFVYANIAMRMSMVRSRTDADYEPTWFPFQLAFILLSMQSAVDRDHPEREVLDLIWFPTGGGKTEAYLGLSCIAIFHRRLLADGGQSGGGTAILTRYTLRLLTVQQFERTARVICACESVRKGRAEELGLEPIRIGLYAGKAATPNKLKQAQELINKRGADSSQTTLPTKVCPWCSTEIKYENQSVEEGRLITRCTGESCEFSDGIPFTCIDEEIYSYPPTFVVGTIDKFAQITWEAASGSLLGDPNLGCLPPGLIIQDELHLISDSLGSITGLYETAIDKICETRGAIPKIIGSTATIKRAESQTKKLFCRAAIQFPPSGISQNDSFFYTEDKTIPGRLYVGVHAQGRSPKHTLPRVIALLKQFCSLIADDELRDTYHTLVCYFNSLRELGGALVLAEDDVPRYLTALDKGGYLPEGSEEVSVNPVKELTSSLSAAEITSMLEELKIGITDEPEEGDPIGLVLSTNMISVGVDVDRLGAMVVNGQPKTTSEYIQASSRVGRPRGSAGLVVTVYNWTRPRDRSHYERFLGYHKAFYKHVEALTVTPFSARARDRALHSVLVAICRHTVPELLAQNSAGKILSAEVKAAVERIIDEVSIRISRIDPVEAEDSRDDLNELLRAWEKEAEYCSSEELCWTNWGLPRDPSRRTMLISDEDSSGAWVTPLSMRDVDAQSPVKLLHKNDIGVSK